MDSDTLWIFISITTLVVCRTFCENVQISYVVLVRSNELSLNLRTGLLKKLCAYAACANHLRPPFPILFWLPFCQAISSQLLVRPGGSAAGLGAPRGSPLARHKFPESHRTARAHGTGVTHLHLPSPSSSIRLSITLSSRPRDEGELL